MASKCSKDECIQENVEQVHMRNIRVFPVCLLQYILKNYQYFQLFWLFSSLVILMMQG